MDETRASADDGHRDGRHGRLPRGAFDGERQLANINSKQVLADVVVVAPVSHRKIIRQILWNFHRSVRAAPHGGKMGVAGIFPIGLMKSGNVSSPIEEVPLLPFA
jgi:hypothetical protein